MVPSSTLEPLNRAGVSIWLDTLSRQLLGSGDFATLIRDCRVELFFGLALDASRV